MLQFEDHEGIQALQPNQQALRFAGRGVISGGEVTATGPDPLDVTITRTEGYFAGTEAVASAGSVNLAEWAGTEPRKLLVCLQAPGTEGGSASFHVEPGEPEESDPEPSNIDEDWPLTTRPAPPALTGRTDLLVLAEVWLGASATQLLDSHIRDRRVSADGTLRRLDLLEADIGSLIDGAGVSHTDELADLADVRTNDGIEAVINDDPDHGSREAGLGAQHDYWDETQTIATVNDQEELTVDITGDAQSLRGHVPSDWAERVHDHDTRYLNDETGVVTPNNCSFDPVTESEFQSRQDAIATSGSATLTGGQNPAAVVSETVAVSLGADLDVDYAVDTSGGFGGGFAFEITKSGWQQRWDPSANGGSGGYTVELTLSWGEDPGSGNDVPIGYNVINEAETEF